MKDAIMTLILFLFVSLMVMPSGCSSPEPAVNDNGCCLDGLGERKAVGFRWSVYGARRTPNTKEFWYNAAEQFNSYFDYTCPEFIWIVGNLRNGGCNLGFPAETDHELIFSAETDLYEETFQLFSDMGVRVWLSFEPGHAPVDELLHLILQQYSHHSCIVGIGIDVEWNDCSEGSKGTPVSDEDALRWIGIAKEYNPDYKFMFRHWRVDVMPPTVREDVMFVSNSQMFSDFGTQVREFQKWGEAFSPAPIGFQIGYPRDRDWWGEYENPPQFMGDSLFAAIPNLGGLYWVDFSTELVFDDINPEKTTGNLLATAREWRAGTDRLGSSHEAGERLISCGVAEVTFHQAAISDRGFPFVELICSLNDNISNYSGGSITYKCDTDLLIKFSQSDFGPAGNSTYSHYQLLVPASVDWNTVSFDFSEFVQPDWAPEVSRSIPIVKENVNAVYLVPALDYQQEESATLKVRDLRLTAGNGLRSY